MYVFLSTRRLSTHCPQPGQAGSADSQLRGALSVAHGLQWVHARTSWPSYLPYWCAVYLFTPCHSRFYLGRSESDGYGSIRDLGQLSSNLGTQAPYKHYNSTTPSYVTVSRKIKLWHYHIMVSYAWMICGSSCRRPTKYNQYKPSYPAMLAGKVVTTLSSLIVYIHEVSSSLPWINIFLQSWWALNMT